MLLNTPFTNTERHTERSCRTAAVGVCVGKASGGAASGEIRDATGGGAVGGISAACATEASNVITCATFCSAPATYRHRAQ